MASFAAPSVPRRTARGRLALGAFSALAALGLSGTPVRAQEVPKPGPDAPDTIYVPYKDLEKIFETEGQGVFLPYKQFLKLWRAQRPPGLVAAGPPPVAAAITGAEYEGTVQGTVARLTARYDIQVLADTWTALPLSFGDLAPSSVEIAGPKGAVLAADGNGHRFLAPGAGTWKLTVQLAGRVEEKPGLRTLALAVPPAPHARLDLRLPGTDLGVDLAPNLAATVEAAGEDTRVLAFLGSAPKLTVTWRPRAKTGPGRKPLLFAKADTAVKLDEGAVQARVRLAWSVLQAPAGEFQIRVPADYQVLSLEGANLRDWSAKAEGAARIVTVTLHSPVEDQYELTLLLERLVKDVAGDLAVPLVEAVGVERERGTVAVGLPATLAAAVSAREGLTQMDPNEVPGEVRPHLPEGKAALAFRYLGGARALTLAVSRVTPRVRAEVAGRLSLGETRRTWRSGVSLTIERAGLFAVRVLLPAGWEPLDIGPANVVEDFRIAPHPEGQLLTVDLRRQTLGGLGLVVELQQRSDGALGSVPLPALRVLDAEKETGTLGVCLPPGYKPVTDADALKGFRPVDLQKVAEAGIQPAAGESVALGFAYARHPLVGSVKIERRAAHVTAQVFTHIAVEENVCKITATVRYTIQHAAIRELKLSLPASMGDVRDSITGVTQPVKEKQPPVAAADAPGRQVFALSLPGDVTGTYDLEVRHEMKLGDLAPGAAVTKAIPDVRVLDVFSEDGWVAVTKGDNIVLELDKYENYEPRDPRELTGPLAALGQPVVQALKHVTRPTNLSLAVTKYDFAPTVETAVNHLHLDALLIPDGTWRAQAWLAVQNVQRQNLPIRMPAGARVVDVWVAGTKRDPSRSAKPDVWLVDLSTAEAAGGARGAPFLVLVRYDLPGGALGSFGSSLVEVPRIEVEANEKSIPTALTTVFLYLPTDEHRVLGLSTDLRRVERRHSLWGRLLEWLGLGPPAVEGATAGRAVMALKGMASGIQGMMAPLHLPPAPSRVLFRNDAGGAVRVHYVGIGMGHVLDIVFFLAAIGAMVWLPATGKSQRWHAVLGGFGVALLASALAEWTTPFAVAVAVGTGAGAAYWLGFALLYEVKWARDRHADDGPPPPPAPPEPPPEPFDSPSLAQGKPPPMPTPLPMASPDAKPPPAHPVAESDDTRSRKAKKGPKKSGGADE